MRAIEIFRVKQVHNEGIVDIVIWQVPEPVAPSTHRYKYRLVFAVNGTRIMGYHNERGKGDHKHLGGYQIPYRFVSPRQLISDFFADINGLNNGATP